MDDLFDEFAGFPSVDVAPGIPIDFDWNNVDLGRVDYGGTVDLGGLQDFGFDLGGGGFDWDQFSKGIESGLNLGGASFDDMAQWYSEPEFDWDQFYGGIESGMDLGGASAEDMAQWYSDYGTQGFAAAADEVGGAGGYDEEELKDKFWREQFAGSGIAGGAKAIPGVGTLTKDSQGRTVIQYEDGTTKVLEDLIDKKSTKEPPVKEPPGKQPPIVSKDNALLLALLGGLMGLLGKGSTPKGPVGYQGGIPKYTATRVPGRGVEYTRAAQGGLMGLAAGGSARPARYLRGGTDGMADKIQTDIDGKQPARLSHGEFVVSADVVSALGSGNSDAGAEVLYDMMDRVRKHAYGRKKQITPVNKRKVLPA